MEGCQCRLAFCCRHRFSWRKLVLSPHGAPLTNLCPESESHRRSVSASYVTLETKCTFRDSVHGFHNIKRACSGRLARDTMACNRCVPHLQLNYWYARPLYDRGGNFRLARFYLFSSILKVLTRSRCKSLPIAAAYDQFIGRLFDLRVRYVHVEFEDHYEFLRNLYVRKQCIAIKIKTI